MAMVLAETLAPRASQKVEIWASDLSLEMLKVAAGAIYTARDVQGVSPHGSGDSSSGATGLATARSGSSRDPRPGQVPAPRPAEPDLAGPADFHMIFCRNVSIYFAEDERMELLNRLAQHLRPAAGWRWATARSSRGAASLRKHSPSFFQKEA